MLGWQKEMKLNRNRQRGNSDWRALGKGKAMYTKVGNCLQPQAWLSGTRESWIRTRKWSWRQRLAVLATRSQTAFDMTVPVVDKTRNRFESENTLRHWASLKPSKQGATESQTDPEHQAAMLGLDAHTRSHWGDGRIKHRLMGKGKQQNA